MFRWYTRRKLNRFIRNVKEQGGKKVIILPGLIQLGDDIMHTPGVVECATVLTLYSEKNVCVLRDGLITKVISVDLRYEKSYRDAYYYLAKGVMAKLVKELPGVEILVDGGPDGIMNMPQLQDFLKSSPAGELDKG
jgi:hypothetical protein